MDKYEYKIKADEIKDLIARRDFTQAADIADGIDWRRVKSVMMLCTISDLYKINRRYEDAMNMLLLAYDRRPGGRAICYSLCELCIKTGDYVHALNYYKEFVRVAPKDSSRYILQYKLYEAQEVGLEERIAVLEELKKRDYREKWAYELAYLYHRAGLATRCVEECDELILWFGVGKFVVKAMELKMLHQPLTPAQQQVYDHRFDSRQPEETVSREQECGEEASYGQPEGYGEEAAYGQPEGYGEEAAYSRPEGYGEESAYSRPEGYGEEAAYGQPEGYGEEAAYSQSEGYGEEASYDRPEGYDGEASYDRPEDYGEEAAYSQPEGYGGEASYDQPEGYGEEASYDQPEGYGEEASYDRPEGYDGAASYDQAAYGEEQAYGAARESGWQPGDGQDGYPAGNEGPDESELDIHVKPVDVGEYNTINLQAELAAGLQEVLGAENVGFSASGPDQQEASGGEAPVHEPEEDEEGTEVFFGETGELGREQEEHQEDSAGLPPEERQESDGGTEGAAQEDKKEEQVLGVQPPRELADLLRQETDGQIKIVLPENANVEKQITGQMKIEDVLAEWERTKKENEEKNKEEVRRDVLRNTGNMFDEFETAARDGLLEQLEKEAAGEGAAREMKARPARKTAEDFAAEEIGDAAVQMTGGDAAAVEYIESLDGPEGPAVPELLEEMEEEGEAETWDETEVLDEPDEAMDSEILYGPEEDGQALEETDGTGEAQIPYEPEEYDETVAETGETEILEDSQEAVDAEAFDDSEEDQEIEILEVPDEPLGTEISAGPEPSDKVEEAGGPKNPPAPDGSKGRKGAKSPRQEGQPRDSSKGQKPPIEQDKEKIRGLTREEKELYAPFIQSRQSREQLVKAIDSISMAAYTGNVVITGDEGMDTMTLAKNIIREVKMTDSNFSGTVAKITGLGLNQRNIRETLERVKNGALIIQDAAGMEPRTADALYRSLQQERVGIIVVMEDTKKAMQKLFLGTPELYSCFNARVNLEAFSNDTLVSFGRRYAREMEYSIDDLGVLALHTRIEELQTIDHAVTVIEVKKIVDEAIGHARKKTFGHFLDVLLARRYDEEDMIILTEKDFVA